MNQKQKTRKAIKQLKAIEKLTDKSMLLAADWTEEWQVLISTILSAQTKDETTIQVSRNLYKKYPTLNKLVKAKLKDVRKIIHQVNYHKTKSKNIIKTAKIIKNKYRGKIPHNIDKLLELPGVGRKTANVFLAVHNHPAIGVDTHLAFLSQILKWTKNKNPHKIEADLQKLFPKIYWRRLNYILVRFGRIHKTRKKQIEKLRQEEII
ncbi:endonuclease III [Candidatus Pacearchaeota archaeon]|nr:endonuclease III [Candidatus Pacearchaeota archaeon]